MKKQRVKFQLKPIVGAVHRALAEGNFHTDVQRSAPMVKQTNRKNPVFWTRAEFKAIVMEILPIMEENGVKFPINETDHIIPKKCSVKPLVFAAQSKILPADRHISTLSPSLQLAIRKRLNQYHYKYYYKKAEKASTESTATPVKVVTGNTGDPKALGEMVGNYITSDREVLKSFLAGLVQAIAIK